MQEAFLHYIWQFQYFDKTAFQTTAGDEVTVFDPGQRNTHSGPDFSNARIRIGGIEWIGNVEVHIYSSGWLDHHHDKDPAYDNVILHVVWEEDKSVNSRQDASRLPTIELKSRVASALLLRYQTLYRNPESIPCASSIARVAPLVRMSMVEKAMVARLERSTAAILKMLETNRGDWEETCYQLLCRNFGFKVNGDPFLSLARSVPLKVIMKHGDKLLQVEALLFGQGGLLEDESDDYAALLRREHALLARKFNLSDRRLNRVQWRFLRLRPANFPTIRIAQLAAVLANQTNIFSRLIDAQSYKALAATLSVRQSDYWLHHYMFGKYQQSEIPQLGRMSIDNIVINTVIPLMAAFAKAKDDRVIAERALAILAEVPSEENSIIRRWNAFGLSAGSALDSQGMIELYNNYCVRRRCLDCTIGSALVRPH